jgi:hypothetical protein
VPPILGAALEALLSEDKRATESLMSDLIKQATEGGTDATEAQHLARLLGLEAGCKSHDH